MTPYELEAWAFTVPISERANVFRVVADSFEDNSQKKEAEVRRSWAQTIDECFIPFDPMKYPFQGFYSCLLERKEWYQPPHWRFENNYRHDFYIDNRGYISKIPGRP